MNLCAALPGTSFAPLTGATQIFVTHKQVKVLASQYGLPSHQLPWITCMATDYSCQALLIAISLIALQKPPVVEYAKRVFSSPISLGAPLPLDGAFMMHGRLFGWLVVWMA